MPRCQGRSRSHGGAIALQEAPRVRRRGSPEPARLSGTPREMPRLFARHRSCLFNSRHVADQLVSRSRRVARRPWGSPCAATPSRGGCRRASGACCGYQIRKCAVSIPSNIAEGKSAEVDRGPYQPSMGGAWIGQPNWKPSWNWGTREGRCLRRDMRGARQPTPKRLAEMIRGPGPIARSDPSMEHRPEDYRARGLAP